MICSIILIKHDQTVYVYLRCILFARTGNVCLQDEQLIDFVLFDVSLLVKRSLC